MLTDSATCWGSPRPSSVAPAIMDPSASLVPNNVLNMSIASTVTSALTAAAVRRLNDSASVGSGWLRGFGRCRDGVVDEGCFKPLGASHGVTSVRRYFDASALFSPFPGECCGDQATALQQA